MSNRFVSLLSWILGDRRRLLCLSVATFALGIGLLVVNQASMRWYSEGWVRNRLPPAGCFIEGEAAFSFAVMGDSAGNEYPFEAILEHVQGQDVAFILHLGDQAKRRSIQHFEWLLQEYAEELGELPLFAVPGNHDVTKDEDDLRLRHYNRAFGQANYWFTYGKTLFIGLDTSDSRFPEERQEWLETVLNRLRPLFDTCVVFAHVPPVDPRPGQNHCMKEDAAALGDILSRHHVDALFCGHIHEFRATTFADVPLYIGPPAGQEMRGATKEFGYMLCAVKEDGAIEVRHVPVTSVSNSEYTEYVVSSKLYKVLIYVAVLCFAVAQLGMYLLYRRASSSVHGHT